MIGQGDAGSLAPGDARRGLLAGDAGHVLLAGEAAALRDRTLAASRRAACALARSSSFAPRASVSSKWSTAWSPPVVTRAECTFEPDDAKAAVSACNRPGRSGADRSAARVPRRARVVEDELDVGTGADTSGPEASRRVARAAGRASGGSLARRAPSTTQPPRRPPHVAADACWIEQPASNSTRVVQAIRPTRSRAATSMRNASSSGSTSTRTSCRPSGGSHRPGLPGEIDRCLRQYVRTGCGADAFLHREGGDEPGGLGPALLHLVAGFPSDQFGMRERGQHELVQCPELVGFGTAVISPARDNR